jgi:8-oxo-dGTP pyrophosphatase MutT (NUDIX family)
MAFEGSYLWKLRQLVGHDLVLMPGAMVFVERDDGQVLLTQRVDDGSWCAPAGAAEVGGSFARTGADELLEETGVQVEHEDLVPFGSLSEEGLHTIHYPNGDVTHCFAMLFSAKKWRRDPRPDGVETSAARFAPVDNPPQPLHAPTARALELLQEYRRTGLFQLR